MFSATKRFFGKSSYCVVCGGDNITFNPSSDRLKLALSAILIPAFCSYFYHLQSGCKYVQFGTIQQNSGNPTLLSEEHISFDEGKIYLLRDAATGKTVAAKIVDIDYIAKKE